MRRRPAVVPLCPYPQEARFTGTTTMANGVPAAANPTDLASVANYTCIEPQSGHGHAYARLSHRPLRATKYIFAHFSSKGAAQIDQIKGEDRMLAQALEA
jgi:hypothetical protein